MEPAAVADSEGLQQEERRRVFRSRAGCLLRAASAGSSDDGSATEPPPYWRRRASLAGGRMSLDAHAARLRERHQVQTELRAWVDDVLAHSRGEAGAGREGEAGRGGDAGRWSDLPAELHGALTGRAPLSPVASAAHLGDRRDAHRCHHRHHRHRHGARPERQRRSARELEAAAGGTAQSPFAAPSLQAPAPGSRAASSADGAGGGGGGGGLLLTPRTAEGCEAVLRAQVEVEVQQRVALQWQAARQVDQAALSQLREEQQRLTRQLAEAQQQLAALAARPQRGTQSAAPPPGKPSGEQRGGGDVCDPGARQREVLARPSSGVQVLTILRQSSGSVDGAPACQGAAGPGAEAPPRPLQELVAPGPPPQRRRGASGAAPAAKAPERGAGRSAEGVAATTGGAASARRRTSAARAAAAAAFGGGKAANAPSTARRRRMAGSAPAQGADAAQQTPAALAERLQHAEAGLRAALAAQHALEAQLRDCQGQLADARAQLQAEGQQAQRAGALAAQVAALQEQLAAAGAAQAQLQRERGQLLARQQELDAQLSLERRQRPEPASEPAGGGAADGCASVRRPCGRCRELEQQLATSRSMELDVAAACQAPAPSAPGRLSRPLSVWPPPQPPAAAEPVGAPCSRPAPACGGCEAAADAAAACARLRPLSYRPPRSAVAGSVTGTAVDGGGPAGCSSPLSCAPLRLAARSASPRTARGARTPRPGTAAPACGWLGGAGSPRRPTRRRQRRAAAAVRRAQLSTAAKRAQASAVRCSALPAPWSCTRGHTMLRSGALAALQQQQQQQQQQREPARRRGGAMTRRCLAQASPAAAPVAALAPAPDGVPPRRNLKTMLLTCPAGALVVLAAGDRRVDLGAVAAHLGVPRRHVRLASAAEALAATGFEVGAIPPFGHAARLRTLVDASVASPPPPAPPSFFAGSGVAGMVQELTAQQLLAAVQPCAVGDFSVDAAAAPPGAGGAQQPQAQPQQPRDAVPPGAWAARLPLPWPPGSSEVALVGVVAQRRRLAKLLLFVSLVPEGVPPLPADGAAVHVRRLWRHPGAAPAAACEVQVICGKTIERALGREAAAALLDQVKVGCVLSVRGRVQQNPAAARAADDSRPQAGAEQHYVLDVVASEVAVLHKSRDTLARALRAAQRRGATGVATATQLLQLQQPAGGASSDGSAARAPARKLPSRDAGPGAAAQAVGAAPAPAPAPRSTAPVPSGSTAREAGECWRLPLAPECVIWVADLAGLQLMRAAVLPHAASGSGSGAAAHVVGMDCEWRPFDRGQAPTPVALLQVATRTQAFLVDLLAICHGGGGCSLAEAALSDLLLQLLCRPDVVKVGWGLAGDLARLQASYPALPCWQPGAAAAVSGAAPPSPRSGAAPLAGHVDLQQLARHVLPPETRHAAASLSLSKLATAVLGAALDKGPQRSAWDIRPLSEEQLLYAANDAHALTVLHDSLVARLPAPRDAVALLAARRGEEWLPVTGTRREGGEAA
ncbi:EXD3 [Scenedesmus sp. PABB004]|nr:EXD3 [Scenedesmus sp. PABB004]